mmetsp:Transcript_26695/g.82106  ORF Transcript_26695/g.82106 Transcript_26695/m.82106 type:complete len:179 (+) Transcript_26695:114-650(+)
MAPTIVLKVKMTCGACVSKVQQTLEALDFVASASVDLKAGEATCTLKDGGAARGEELVAALKAASYEVTACGSGSGKPCPAVAAGTCTCGPLCECGDSCECAACPASCGKAEAACPAKAEGTCTCGPECRCGPFCACVDCPGGKKALTLSVSITTDLIVGLVAGLAIGFVLASKRAAK